MDLTRFGIDLGLGQMVSRKGGLFQSAIFSAHRLGVSETRIISPFSSNLAHLIWLRNKSV